MDSRSSLSDTGYWLAFRDLHVFLGRVNLRVAMNPQTFYLVLMLTRVCISEGGFDNHKECAVIVHALVEQAGVRGIPLRTQICLYAPNSCNPDRRDSRRWISALHPESRTRPPGFPRMLSWTSYRPKVAAMFVTAYQAYLGAIPSPCPGAFHWGATWCGACRRRMRTAGYDRIQCEGVDNHWWGHSFDPMPVIKPEPVCS